MVDHERLAGVLVDFARNRVSEHDLEDVTQFHRFAPRALEAGLRDVDSFPRSPTRPSGCAGTHAGTG